MLFSRPCFLITQRFLVTIFAYFHSAKLACFELISAGTGAANRAYAFRDHPAFFGCADHKGALFFLG